MLNSKLPVLVWVGPNGATAASAGVWIAQAADYLGMAPQTNIGSSTPISSGGANIDSDLRRKLINHEAASLRALAQSHGRNVEWADQAVRVATNATATEALQMNVIDAIAPTLPSLARAGRRRHDQAARIHAPPRRRPDRSPAPRFLHAAAQHADRSEHPPPALPRRPRGHRLRDLSSGRRSTRRARAGRARRRALRLLGHTHQLGRARC